MFGIEGAQPNLVEARPQGDVNREEPSRGGGEGDGGLLSLRHVREIAEAVDASFEELSSAASVGSSIRASLLVEDACERLAGVLRASLPAAMVHITLWRDGGGPAFRWGEDASPGGGRVELVEEHSPGEGSERPRIMNDLGFQLQARPSSEVIRAMLAMGMRSSIAVDLVYLGTSVGVLRLACSREQAYTPAHSRALLRCREQVGGLLDRALWSARLLDERVRMEQLRRAVLPERLALLQPPPEVGFASWHSGVSVIVADLVDFSSMGNGGAWNLVGLISEVFSRFDAACDAHGVEKIKSVGDTYLAASGLAAEGSEHPLQAVQAAQAMVEAVHEIAEKHQVALKVRIGVATGPAVSGIVGGRRISFDIWGEAVSLAGKLESHGIAGRVQLCEKTARGVAGRFLMESRGVVRLAGVGAVRAWLLSV